MFYSKLGTGFFVDLASAPDDAVEVSDEVYNALLKANSQGATIEADEDGYPIAIPPPEPTFEELINQAVHAVKQKLQATIDEKAVALGFSNGNALMLYAGFANAFQPLAQTFATWEASVWVEADEYKQQVITGNKPMLSPDEAVAMMPVYPN